MTSYVTPGSNTLRQAQSIQGQQAINYFRANGRQNNANGVFVPVFLPPVLVRGSVQPIKRSKTENIGVEYQQDRVTLYVTQYMQDLDRGTAGDQFSWNGKIWQLESNINWAGPDGWTGVECVAVGPDPNIYLTLGFYVDPGVTDSSTYVFPSQSIPDGALLVIDAPIWTVGDGFYDALAFSGLSFEQAVSVNVAIGGVQQGSVDAVADHTGDRKSVV